MHYYDTGYAHADLRPIAPVAVIGPEMTRDAARAQAIRAITSEV
jgi:hypothetical protein